MRKAVRHRFTTDVPAGLPAVEADPRRIRQLVDNLLTNAVKYSPEGTKVRIACLATDGAVQVSVKDQGRGIKQEDLEKIFDRFYRGEADASHTIGGAGLGLAICKTIVESHEGRIWAESEPGNGSTFCFALPLGVWEGEPQP